MLRYRRLRPAAIGVAWCAAGLAFGAASLGMFLSIYTSGYIDDYLLEFWAIVAVTLGALGGAWALAARISRSAALGFRAAFFLYGIAALVLFWLLHLVIA